MRLKSKRWTWASIETEKTPYHSSFFGPLFLWGFSFFFTFALWAGEEFSGAKTSKDLTWITIPAGGVHRRLKVSSNSSPAPHSHFFCIKKNSAEGDEFEMRARGEEKCLYGASLFPPCGGRDSRERAKVSVRKESGAHYLTEKQPFPFFFLMQLSSFATLTTRAVLTFFQSKTTIFLPSAFIFPDIYTAHCICK